VLVGFLMLVAGCDDDDSSSSIATDGGLYDLPDVLWDAQTDVVLPIGCESDADCPGKKCNPFNHSCVDCLTSQDCGQGQVCEKWTCVDVIVCDENADCPDGLLCNLEEGVCQECVEDGDCPNDGTCVEGECEIPCGNGCPEGLVCDELTGLCVECVKDEDCPVEKWCFFDSGDCMPDVCIPGEKTCVGDQLATCAPNGSGWIDLVFCPDGMVCDAGQCIGICVPQCDGKQCGPDGCQGDCGFCAEGTVCQDFFCVPFGDCEPGQTACFGNAIAWCNDDGVWEGGKECPPGTQCVEDWGAECIPVGPGECGQMLECLMETECEEPEPVCSDWCFDEAGDPPELLFEVYACVFDVCNQWAPGSQCFQFALEVPCADVYQACMGENPWECFPGEMGCEGNVVLICNDVGQWEWMEECPPGTQCEAGMCIQVEPGTCAAIVECMMGQSCWEPEAWACMEPCMTSPVFDEQAELAAKLYECVFNFCGGWMPDGGDECFWFALEEGCWVFYDQCMGGCVPSCTGKQCGSDGCGGQCGTCPEKLQCTPAGKCELPCQPNCGNKDCGSNGCGGSCGTCPAGASCNKDGICEIVCQPNCDLVACGSDGCGGSCGLCPNGQACLYGECVWATSCEELADCIWDCPQWDQACKGQCYQKASPEAQDQWWQLVQCIQEVCGPQPQEGCGGKAIQGECAEVWNACQDCTPMCVGKMCGADGCGGNCGVCPAGFACDNFGTCLCQPQCEGKECGLDSCGGSCGTCPKGDVCNFLGFCICNPKCEGKQCGKDGCGGTCGKCPPGAECGPDGQCLPGPIMCGDGWCDEQLGESCDNCPLDCPCFFSCCEPHDMPGCDDPEVTDCTCMFDEFCCQQFWDDLCVGEAIEQCGLNCGGCKPNCFNKECGPDGCQGSCGTCPPATSCNAGGICEQVCKPNCKDKACGSDGCGGSCGLCSAGMACVQNACIPSSSCEELVDCWWSCPPFDEDCEAQCSQNASPEAKEQWWELAGCIMQYCDDNSPDGCWQNAINGPCIEYWLACQGCTPACEGKQCGDDGCGGDCGQCPGGYACDPFGYCICEPQCEDKVCGKNGCGGSCGTCPAGQICNYLGHCVCVPQCQGKECGSDGCGGECGQCPADMVCNMFGLCEPGQPMICGDGICAFEMGEDCNTCPWDCPCGGDCCQPHDFPGCDMPEVMKCVCEFSPWCCEEWWSEECVDTAQWQCGWQCGESCGDGWCDWTETCESCPWDCGECDFCGDGMCTWNENCATCPMDCGPCNPCGDGKCAATESCLTCALDCGPCQFGDCCQAQDHAGCENVEVMKCACVQFDWCCTKIWDESCVKIAQSECGLNCCKPNCAGKTCGPDGCGGSCGTCPPNSSCQNGKCVNVCVPSCVSSDGTKKQCGDDGCGGVCGVCPAGTACQNGKCVNACIPNCVNADGTKKQCGPDGCGGTCGTCKEGTTCQNGVCVLPCVPNCAGPGGLKKMCGSDGCGGNCGLCPQGTVCDVAAGLCVPQCTPNCAGKQCGQDGCGGSCGTCKEGTSCQNGQCVAATLCPGMVDCALVCGFKFTCQAQCYGSGDAQSKDLFNALFFCVVQACGFNLTETCIKGSFQAQCAQQYQACTADK
jgi:hypothetical protein